LPDLNNVTDDQVEVARCTGNSKNIKLLCGTVSRSGGETFVTSSKLECTLHCHQECTLYCKRL